MKSWFAFGMLLVASVLLTACTSEARATSPNAPPPLPVPPTSQVDDGACAQICGETSALKCGTEAACLTACAEMRESTACRSEIGAFVACASARKSADWECGDNAMPVLKDGVCNSEQGAITSCMEALAKR